MEQELGLVGRAPVHNDGFLGNVRTRNSTTAHLESIKDS